MRYQRRIPKKFRAQLQHALDLGGNTHTLDDVEDSIQPGGPCQLWLNEGGILISQALVHPRALEISFWLAAGSLDAVLELSDTALVWAKSAGFTLASCTGRPGWERVLARRGWTSRMVTMGRTIEHG